MKKNSLSSRIQSFSHAIHGITTAFKTEHNLWIHLTVAAVVIVAGVFFSVTPFEWSALIFAIVLVLSAELFNTAIESLCDALHPKPHSLIKQAKDVAAGAVLVTAIGAATVGLIVFIPYLIG